MVSEARYMSLRTLATTAAGTLASVSCWRTWSPMEPAMDASAGRVVGSTALVRT